MRHPGVAMGASGPGATNLLAGVANAFTNAVPGGTGRENLR
jgi:thiamine pyrophosphate-dependent acetolactate synthase large subunit-like protein